MKKPSADSAEGFCLYSFFWSQFYFVSNALGLSRSEQPLIILPPIDHILHIDHLIFYLIQQNVVFVKDELAILLDRKNLGTQHRIAKRKSFQRDCRLTKIGNQFVRQFFIQPCGKCRMLHQPYVRALPVFLYQRMCRK